MLHVSRHDRQVQLCKTIVGGFTELVKRFLCTACKTTLFMLSWTLLAMCNLFHFDTIMEPEPHSIDQEGKQIPISDGANAILIRLHIRLKMISSSHTFCIHITHTILSQTEYCAHTTCVFEVLVHICSSFRRYYSYFLCFLFHSCECLKMVFSKTYSFGEKI